MTNKESINTPRIGNLITASDCRREIAKVYKLGRRGDMQTSDMTRFASVLQILIGAIRDGDFEERLKQLEEQQLLPRGERHGVSKQH